MVAKAATRGSSRPIRTASHLAVIAGWRRPCHQAPIIFIGKLTLRTRASPCARHHGLARRADSVVATGAAAIGITQGARTRTVRCRGQLARIRRPSSGRRRGVHRYITPRLLTHDHLTAFYGERTPSDSTKKPRRCRGADTQRGRHPSNAEALPDRHRAEKGLSSRPNYKEVSTRIWRAKAPSPLVTLTIDYWYLM